MGSYSSFLLIFCVIPLIQCASTPGEIRSSMSIEATKKLGLAKDNNTSADITSFENFIIKFNKTFENEAEAQKRRGIFLNNVKEIDKHNKLYASGKSSYQMGVNMYSDITIDELISTPTGYNDSDVTHGYTRSTGYYDPIDIGDEPDSKDWRDESVVNSPRDQGSQKTCWAFSATASIESAIAIKYGVLQELSEQNLIECTGTSGCPSGSKTKAIDYVIDNGIALRKGYPYTPGNYDTCKLKPTKTTYNITSNRSIRSGQDDELLNALVHVGPVSVGMFVGFSEFTQYRTGIFENIKCTENVKTNHAVLLVGYGTENGHKYWLLRNSWGTSWGEQGYMKLSRKISNYCRISSTAVVPSGAEKFLSSTLFLVFTTFSCIMINKVLNSF